MLWSYPAYTKIVPSDSPLIVVVPALPILNQEFGRSNRSDPVRSLKIISYQTHSVDTVLLHRADRAPYTRVRTVVGPDCTTWLWPSTRRGSPPQPQKSPRRAHGLPSDHCPIQISSAGSKNPFLRQQLHHIFCHRHHPLRHHISCTHHQDHRRRRRCRDSCCYPAAMLFYYGYNHGLLLRYPPPPSSTTKDNPTERKQPPPRPKTNHRREFWVRVPA